MGTATLHLTIGAALPSGAPLSCAAPTLRAGGGVWEVGRALRGLEPEAAGLPRTKSSFGALQTRLRSCGWSGDARGRHEDGGRSGAKTHALPASSPRWRGPSGDAVRLVRELKDAARRCRRGA